MKKFKGDWMETYTGKRLYVLDPELEKIDIIDIAKGLSNICRFGGQIKTNYCVGQHSIIASDLGCLVTQRNCSVHEFQLALLLHDAEEAYLQDYPRPVKVSIPQLSKVGDKLRNVIFKKFGLKDYCHYKSDIKKIDDIVLMIEAVCLKNKKARQEWGGACLIPTIALDVKPWSHTKVFTEFMKRFKQLDLMQF